MDHFGDYYYQNKVITHETDLESTLDILNKYIMSVGEEDADLLSHVVSFLDMGELQNFINDSLKHYVYKRIFNMTLLLYKNNKQNYEKDQRLFIEDFQVAFKRTYTFHHNDNDDFEDLAKKMYKLVQSPDKSRNASLIGSLRKHAEITKINCYLCGVEVDFDTDYLISLYDAKQANLKKENIDKIEKHQKNIQLLLKKFLNKPSKFISKTKKYKTKFSRFNRVSFVNSYNESMNLQDFNSIFIDASFNINSNKCEIEHNFPAGWGGDSSSKNIFVACHKCNNAKDDIAFYTDIDYSNIFSNSYKISNIRRNVSAKAKIAIKIKQNFSCKNDKCVNKLGQKKQFYLINENPEHGLTFFNLSMYCEDCIESIYAKSKKISKEEYIKEYTIHLN